MNTVARAYTDGTYASRNPKFGDDNAEWKVANALKAVSKWDIPHDRIAEVGCGGGAIIRGVADSLEAQQAVGFEPMPEAYAVAKERETDKLTFRNQTIDETTEEAAQAVARAACEKLLANPVMEDYAIVLEQVEEELAE